MASPQQTCGRGRWNRLAGALACTLLIGTAQAGSEAPPLAEIAAQVRRSHGPSGANLEYVLRLAESLREHGADDEHVFALEWLLRR